MEELPSGIHPSWHSHLLPLFQHPDIIDLKNNILPNCKYYPRGENIFRVFQMPLDKIKVVILGQDPYPTFPLATGLAFGVPQHIRIPPSLKVIQRELINEGLIPSTDDKDYIFDKTLEKWFYQGVFLLNTALTVEANKIGSHTSYWVTFIEGVIDIISREAKPIWLLWGSYARGMGEIIFQHHEDGRPKGHILNRTMSCAHPNAESYVKDGGRAGFYGCNHFKKVNDLLTQNGQQAINW